MFGRSGLYSRRSLGGETDRNLLWGLLTAFGLVFAAVVAGGEIDAFLDIRSFLIVCGGTFGAALVALPKKDIEAAIPLFKRMLTPPPLNAQQRIDQILELARRARKDGTLSIQTAVYHEPDPFMRKCIELVVDDLPPADIHRTLEIELAVEEDRARHGAQVFQTLGGLAPAMGLIGTLIGLIQMLKNLEDATMIGPAMALALLTTFYGALLANVVFLPLAAKLRRLCSEELLIKELTLEGVLEIVRGINPRLVETRLEGFLPPEQRNSRLG
jgi:chemotaxis protein MotA